MNESADESDLVCLSKPDEVSLRSTPRVPNKLTKDNLAAIQDTNDFVPWCSIRLDFEEFYTLLVLSTN